MWFVYYKDRIFNEWRLNKLRCIRMIIQQLKTWGDPLYFLRRWNIRKLYDGYLNNRDVAENFKRTYLPEELQGGEGLVLDYGCGKGRHSAMLSQCGFKVVGIDLLRYDYWGKIPNAQFIQGDERELVSLKGKGFDLCISFLVLPYIRDDQEVLNCLFQVIKVAGWLVLQLPNKNNLKAIVTRQKLAYDPYILRYYTLEESLLMLENAGFRVEKVWTERFYSPFLTGFCACLLDYVFPHQVRDFMSQHTPPKYRGLINIIAQKVGE